MPQNKNKYPENRYEEEKGLYEAKGKGTEHYLQIIKKPTTNLASSTVAEVRIPHFHRACSDAKMIPRACFYPPRALHALWTRAK